MPIPRIGNTGSGSGGMSPATKVVATGSSGFVADYYTDGVNDEVEIQSAINAVNALGGGTVLIKDGTYNISATINMFRYIHLMGSGYGTKLSLTTATTLLKFPNTGGSPAVPLHIEIDHIRFWGNGLNATAVNCGTNGQEFYLKNNWFQNWHADSSCILTTTNKKIQIIGNMFGGSRTQPENEFCGIGTAIKLSTTGDVEIIGNNIHGFKKGIAGTTEKTSITANTFYSSLASEAPDTSCIELGTVAGGLQIVNIVGNNFSDTDVAIKLSGAGSTQRGANIVGNFFRNTELNAISIRGSHHTISSNFFQDICLSGTGNNGMGILIFDASYISVIGNTCFNNGTNMGYFIAPLDANTGPFFIIGNEAVGRSLSLIRFPVGITMEVGHNQE